MMHTYKELYKINGRGYYTADYIIANNVPKAIEYEEEGWSHCVSLGTDKGVKNVHTAKGKKTVYTYGEKTWFDTAKERDAHREAMAQERVEQTKRNKLLKTIKEHYEEMTTEQLEMALVMLKR